MRQPMLRSGIVTLLFLVVWGPAPARAQSVLSGPGPAWETRAWMGDVAFLSANALLAGLTAGVLQELRDGSFQDGFTRGALGGVLAYGGRNLAARDFWGAGLLGRQVSAVGASVVNNAGAGRPALSRITLPIGPVGIQLRRGPGGGIWPRLDVNGAVWLVSALLEERLVLDPGASLSAGAPVFRAPGHHLASAGRPVDGLAVAGVIVLGHDADRRPGHDVLAHERVHVLQYDFAQEVWGDPLERRIGGLIPGAPPVLRFIRPGIVYPGLKGWAVDLLDLEWWERPWEMEAEYLEHK